MADLALSSSSMHTLLHPLSGFASLTVCGTRSTLACVGLVTTELVGIVLTTVFLILTLLQIAYRPTTPRRPRPAHPCRSTSAPTVSLSPPHPPSTPPPRPRPQHQSTVLPSPSSQVTFTLPASYAQRSQSDPGLSPSPSKAGEAQFERAEEPETPTPAARPRPTPVITVPRMKRPFGRSKTTSRVVQTPPSNASSSSTYAPQLRPLVQSPIEMPLSPAKPTLRSAKSSVPRPHSFPSSRTWSEDSGTPSQKSAREKERESRGFWRRKEKEKGTEREPTVLRKSSTMGDVRKGAMAPPPYTPSPAQEEKHHHHHRMSGFTKRLERIFHPSPKEGKDPKPVLAPSMSPAPSSTSSSRHSTLSRRRWSKLTPTTTPTPTPTAAPGPGL